MKRKIAYMMLVSVFLTGMSYAQQQEKVEKDRLWQDLSSYFSPPEKFKGEYGNFRSLLHFYDGKEVKTAEDWQDRRAEILERWNGLMGEWPEFLTEQKLTIIDSVQKEGFMQYKVSFNWLPNEKTEGYLLVPEGEEKKPAVITVFYEPETAIGEGKADRDFALQLTQRGFVTLSIGTKETTEEKIYSLYYPSVEKAEIQPLSTLAYAAANAWYALSNFEEVDADRIGIMGHSYGGKWAMFASCLFDKFASGVWVDPGIVFDETKGSGVNYWEPWYLGYYPPPWENTWRKTGMIQDAKGLYPKLVKEGYDLHELHALMAPRPFLVSGGSSDPEERWVPLNHTIAVNKLLGFKDRVAMTNRVEHSPNKKSNEQVFKFLEYFLK